VLWWGTGGGVGVVSVKINVVRCGWGVGVDGVLWGRVVERGGWVGGCGCRQGADVGFVGRAGV